MKKLGTELEKNKKRTREERAAIVQRFEKSGLTQRAFAEKERLSVWNLRNWIRSYRKNQKLLGTKAKGIQGASFVEVDWEPHQSRSASSSYRLGYGEIGGWIEVEKGFCAQEVQALYAIIMEAK